MKEYVGLIESVIHTLLAIVGVVALWYESSKYIKVKRLEQRVAILNKLHDAVTEFYRAQYHYGVKQATGDNSPELASDKASYDIAIMRMQSWVETFRLPKMTKVFWDCFGKPGGAAITNVTGIPLSGPAHLFVKYMYRLIAKELLDK